jgi:dimethylhistidine N-methyltransferase
MALQDLGVRRKLPPDCSFLKEVVHGLSLPQKTLPSSFFYDAAGSELFEQITDLPEYYPTRAECALLTAHAAAMVQAFGAHGVLVEFGSGSSTKTELLLPHLPRCAAYAPIDVSQAALRGACSRLAHHFPDLEIVPIVADFAMLPRLPVQLAARSKFGFFPGSTIGNFQPGEAVRLLQHFRKLLEPHGQLLIGVDLKKDRHILERAYNDSQGVTAAFNLNVLARINREIAPVIDLETFAHNAVYNEREGRIEMHLISRRDQSFELGGCRISFRAGETIHTENAYKYTVAQFQDLARSAGWTPERSWKDAKGLFSIHELRS